jgi:hypothetical protein
VTFDHAGPVGTVARVEPHVTLDPRSLSPVEAKLRGPLEDQLTSALKAAADRIAADCTGAPVDVVAARLLEEAKSGLHPDIAAGFSPDPAELRRLAESLCPPTSRA